MNCNELQCTVVKLVRLPHYNAPFAFSLWGYVSDLIKKLWTFMEVESQNLH